jgi:hypothetical protein
MRRTGGPRALAAGLVVACAGYPFIAFGVLSVLRDHTPIVYDGLLTRLDGPWGHALLVACNRLLGHSTALRVVSIGAYDGSVLIAMLAIAARWRLRAGGDVLLPAALLVTATVGPLCYEIVPAMGPAFYWPRFPSIPDVSLAATQAAVNPAFRNAMPSLHFTVALIVTASLWELGIIARAGGLAFVLVTLFATLGFGEHYVVDLVMAIPFAAAVWLATIGRRPAASVCGLVTLIALLAMRLAA